MLHDQRPDFVFEEFSCSAVGAAAEEQDRVTAMNNAANKTKPLRDRLLISFVAALTGYSEV